MPRPRRGAKGRLASPAQMARLSAILDTQFPRPIPFESWRDMMRSHRHPEANSDTREAAWEHLNSRDTEANALIAAFSQALHEAARPR